MTDRAWRRSGSQGQPRGSAGVLYTREAKAEEEGEMPESEDVRRIKELHKMAILVRRNVVGVGVGYKVKGRTTTGELSLVALVRR